MKPDRINKKRIKAMKRSKRRGLNYVSSRPEFGEFIKIRTPGAL